MFYKKKNHFCCTVYKPNSLKQHIQVPSFAIEPPMFKMIHFQAQKASVWWSFLLNCLSLFWLVFWQSLKIAYLPVSFQGFKYLYLTPQDYTCISAANAVHCHHVEEGGESRYEKSSVSFFGRCRKLATKTVWHPPFQIHHHWHHREGRWSRGRESARFRHHRRRIISGLWGDYNY